MTLTGRSATLVLVALVVSLCLNLLLAGMMMGGRWHDGPRHRPPFGMMSDIPEEARPVVKDVFAARRAEFDAHRDRMRQARQNVAELLKADPIDQPRLDQALGELLRESQAMQQFGHQVMIELARKLPPDLRREMADRWARDRFGRNPDLD